MVVWFFMSMALFFTPRLNLLFGLFEGVGDAVVDRRFRGLCGGAGGGVGAGVFVVAEPMGCGGLVWACGRVRVWGDAPWVFVPAEARSQASAPRSLVGAGQVRRARLAWVACLVLR